MLYNDYFTLCIGQVLLYYNPYFTREIEVHFSKSRSLQKETVLASTTTLLNCSRNCVIHFILFTILFRSLEDNLSLEFLVYIENKIGNNLEFSFKNSILLVFNGQKG